MMLFLDNTTNLAWYHNLSLTSWLCVKFLCVKFLLSSPGNLICISLYNILSNLPSDFITSDFIIRHQQFVVILLGDNHETDTVDILLPMRIFLLDMVETIFYTVKTVEIISFRLSRNSCISILSEEAWILLPSVLILQFSFRYLLDAPGNLLDWLVVNSSCGTLLNSLTISTSASATCSIGSSRLLGICFGGWYCFVSYLSL